jgi:hypothetical protein
MSLSEKNPDKRGKAYSILISAQDFIKIIEASRSDFAYQSTDIKNLTRITGLFD